MQTTTGCFRHASSIARDVFHVTSVLSAMLLMKEAIPAVSSA
jgi:hypothetical protein